MPGLPSALVEFLRGRRIRTTSIEPVQFSFGFSSCLPGMLGSDSIALELIFHCRAQKCELQQTGRIDRRLTGSCHEMGSSAP